MSQNNPHQSALRIGRHSTPGQIYHVTFTTHQRSQLNHSAQVGIARFLSSTDFHQYAQPLAWVIMPDHLHMLLQLTDHHSLSRVIQRLKSRSALTVNRASGRNGRLWQNGFYDHALRQDEDIKNVARYIIQNPIRAGLVDQVGDYPFWNAIWI